MRNKRSKHLSLTLTRKVRIVRNRGTRPYPPLGTRTPTRLDLNRFDFAIPLQSFKDRLERALLGMVA